MRGEQVVVAVVVQYAHAGHVRAGRDDHIGSGRDDGGRCRQARAAPATLWLRLLDRSLRAEVCARSDIIAVRSAPDACRVTGLEQKRQARHELLPAQPPFNRLRPICSKTLGGEASPGRVVEQQHPDGRQSTINPSRLTSSAALTSTGIERSRTILASRVAASRAALASSGSWRAFAWRTEHHQLGVVDPLAVETGTLFVQCLANGWCLGDRVARMRSRHSTSVAPCSTFSRSAPALEQILVGRPRARPAPARPSRPRARARRA